MLAYESCILLPDKTGMPFPRRRRIAIVAYWYSTIKAEGLVSAKLAWMFASRGWDVTVFCAVRGDVPRVIREQGLEPEVVVVPHVKEDVNAYILQRWNARVSNYLYGAENDERKWIEDVAAVILKNDVDGNCYDVLYTRLEPYLCHMVGLNVVDRLSHAVWVGYFSDPWPHSILPYPYMVSYSVLRRLRYMIMLFRFFQRMDCIVHPSIRQRNYVHARLHGYALRKANAIPHLPAWWSGDVRSRPRSALLLLRYAGTLTRWRPVEVLYRAIDILRVSSPTSIPVKIEIMGRLYGYDGNELKVPDGYADIVSTLPPVGLDDSLDWQGDADAVMLIEGDFEEGIFLPSKLVDIIASRSVLFAISPSVGVVADLGKRYSGCGKELLRASPSSPTEVAEIVSRLIQAKVRDELHQFRVPAELVAEYSIDYVYELHSSMFDRTRLSYVA